MVHFDREVVPVLLHGIEPLVVVSQVRIQTAGRSTRQALHHLGECTDPVARNDVSGKRLPDSVGVGRERIVNGGWPPVRVDDVAQVAAPHRRRRHPVVCELRAALDQPFVGPEPECLVVPVVQLSQEQGPAGRHTELVADQMRFRRSRGLLAPVRQQTTLVVPMRFEGGPVELVGPASGRKRDRRRTREAGVGADGLDPEFLDRIQPGLDPRDAAAKAVHHGNAVQRDFQRPHLHAAHPGIAASLDAGSQIEQRTDGPAVQGQLADALVVLDVRHVRAFQRNRRSRAADLNHVLDLAHLQDRIDLGRLADLKLQFAGPLLEAGQLHVQRVLAARDRPEVKGARVGRHLPASRSRFSIGQRETGAGNDSATEI